MKLVAEAWTRWVLLLAFDLWRYPDFNHKRETPGAEVRASDR